MSCSTPVVLIIFRRPDVTVRVFEQIRLAQPRELFVIADGPRSEEEDIRCREARAITEKVDWDCDAFRDYSDINLGCRRRVSSGLDWIFSQVDKAIILEDDCLPNQSFFAFCEILLNHYQNDNRIWMISGNNFQSGKVRGDGSYYFSRYPHCWGWATWKRAWVNYQDDLSSWYRFRDFGLLNTVFESPEEIRYWIRIFEKMIITGEPDSWAYRWAYTCWSNNALTVIPNVNLVSNLGFSNEASNTKNLADERANAPVGDILSLKHPSFLVRDAAADHLTSKKLFRSSSAIPLLNRVKGKMKSEIEKFVHFIRQ
jgi:hypothetical protein